MSIKSYTLSAAAVVLSGAVILSVTSPRTLPSVYQQYLQPHNPFSSKTVSNVVRSQKQDDTNLEAEDESEDQLNSETGFFEAAYFFITGLEADISKLSGQTYDEGEFRFEGARIKTEYQLEGNCKIRQIVTQVTEKDGTKTGSNTYYDFNRVTGQYYYSQGRNLWNEQVYTLKAFGKKSNCKNSDMFEKKLDPIVGVGCFDDIDRNYNSSLTRDRAIKAFNLITSNYCKTISPKPF